MQIHQFATDTVAAKTAESIYSRLSELLAQGPTGFLLSGGSAGMEVGLALVNLCELHPLPNVVHLKLSVVDERYGKPWHSNSNMLLLKQTGLIDLFERYGATFLPPLSDLNINLLSAAVRYDEQLQGLFNVAQDRVVGVFGIGADGHTAGILPEASAQAFSERYEGPEWVIGYKADDFDRITVTPKVIKRIPYVYVYAKGDRKKTALTTMLTTKLTDKHRCPAVIFQEVFDAQLFTDLREIAAVRFQK